MVIDKKRKQANLDLRRKREPIARPKTNELWSSSILLWDFGSSGHWIRYVWCLYLTFGIKVSIKTAPSVKNDPFHIDFFDWKTHSYFWILSRPLFVPSMESTESVTIFSLVQIPIMIKKRENSTRINISNEFKYYLHFWQRFLAADCVYTLECLPNLCYQERVCMCLRGRCVAVLIVKSTRYFLQVQWVWLRSTCVTIIIYLQRSIRPGST